MKNLIVLLSLFAVLSCQQQTKQAPDAASTSNENPKNAVNEDFNRLFEEVNVVKMHLFAPGDTTLNEENYPYVGKPIPGEMAQYLPDGINGQRGAFACYRTENSGHFILRVAGENGKSELVLSRWDEAAGKLAMVADLAYLRCEGGTCTKQDTWLTDLDDNRLLELITRSHRQDANGKITDETFKVSTDDGNGNFINTDENLAALAVKSNYVMQ